MVVAGTKPRMRKADRPGSLAGHNQAEPVKPRLGEDVFFQERRSDRLEPATQRRLSPPDLRQCRRIPILKWAIADQGAAPAEDNGDSWQVARLDASIYA